MRRSQSDGAGEIKPLVSIGMPVFNEARFLGQAVEALLAQTYPHLEIIISDNASTDETETICRWAASKDRRIHYSRFTENQGVTANFQHVLEKASGDYFLWASGHDLWSENLVQECVALLESHPAALLAFASSQWIGEEGEVLAKESGWSDTRGLSPIARFMTVLWGNMHPILGVMRTQALRSIPKIQDCVGADLIVLAELALSGDFLHAPGALWSRRLFRAPETHDARMERYQDKSFGMGQSALDRIFPLLRLPMGLMGVVQRAALGWPDKLCLAAMLVPALPARYFVGRARR